jgi:hypothetical protein
LRPPEASREAPEGGRFEVKPCFRQMPAMGGLPTGC